MPDVTVSNDGPYPQINVQIVPEKPSFTANTTVNQLTVENTGDYPSLNLNTGTQYPSLTILPPREIILGGGGGGGGAAGADGAQGTQGTQGTQGIQGLQGIMGIQGDPGDRYKTTSSTSITVGGLTSVTLTVADNNLAYTPKQEVIIVSTANSAVYFNAIVTSYSGYTLIVSVTSQVGSGTYTAWAINLTGLQGPAGNTGATGSISINEQLFDQNTGITKSSSFVTGTSGLARKLVFLAQDGSLTFDFIRNYDVFNPADLSFAISSFTTNISSNNLIGTGNFSLNSKTATIAYTAVSVPTGLTLSISSGFGFPITVNSPYTSYAFTSAAGVTYTTPPQTITLTATARDGSGSSSVATTNFSFINNIYYGLSTLTSLTSPGVVALTAVLQNSKAYSFTITSGAGQYVYYAYPSRLGTATFTVGGFAGGFELPVTLSVTNSNGYAENYYIYRSTNANLGTRNVVVT
jgi:hypothetical protein